MLLPTLLAVAWVASGWTATPAVARTAAALTTSTAVPAPMTAAVNIPQPTMTRSSGPQTKLMRAGGMSYGLGLTTPAGVAAEDVRGLFAVRAPNAAHPPNAGVVGAMRGSYHPCYDCSEIAEDLLAAAGGQGRILTYTPAKGSMLRTPESGGQSVQDFVYHSVYTDGRYAYDPRFSPVPVPLGDFNRMMRGLNPGVMFR